MFRERWCHYPRNTIPVTLPPGHLPISDNIPQFFRLSSGTGSFSAQRGSFFFAKKRHRRLVVAPATPSCTPPIGPFGVLMPPRSGVPAQQTLMAPSWDRLPNFYRRRPCYPLRGATPSGRLSQPHPAHAGVLHRYYSGAPLPWARPPTLKSARIRRFSDGSPPPSGRLGRTACTAGRSDPVAWRVLHPLRTSASPRRTAATFPGTAGWGEAEGNCRHRLSTCMTYTTAL